LYSKKENRKEVYWSGGKAKGKEMIDDIFMDIKNHQIPGRWKTLIN